MSRLPVPEDLAQSPLQANPTLTHTQKLQIKHKKKNYGLPGTEYDPWPKFENQNWSSQPPTTPQNYTKHHTHVALSRLPVLRVRAQNSPVHTHTHTQMTLQKKKFFFSQCESRRLGGLPLPHRALLHPTEPNPTLPYLTVTIPLIPFSLLGPRLRCHTKTNTHTTRAHRSLAPPLRLSPAPFPL